MELRERKKYDRKRYLSIRTTKRYKEQWQKRKHLQGPHFRKLRRENKLKAIEYLGGRCAHCKQIFPTCVYDFHHIDPLTKEKSIGLLLSNNWSEKIIYEIKKCLLLCANCHRILHHVRKK